MPRPSDNFWQDSTSPFLYPGLNDRENAVKDYAEELAGLPVFNIADYGAVLDGTTDDSVAAQDAIDAMPANGGVLYNPYGTALVQSLFMDGKTGAMITGPGLWKRYPAAGNIRIMTIGDTTPCHDLTIQGCRFDVNGIEMYGGVNIYSSNRVRILNNTVIDSDLDPSWRSFDHYCFVVQDGQYLWFLGNYVDNVELLELNNWDYAQISHNVSTRAAGTTAYGSFAVGNGYHFNHIEFSHNLIIDSRRLSIVVQNEAGGQSDAQFIDFKITHNTVAHLTITASGTGDTTSGSPTILNATGGPYTLHHYLTGPGIVTGSQITAIAGSTLTLDTNATATATGVAIQETYSGGFNYMLNLGSFTGTVSGTGNVREDILINDNVFYVNPAMAPRTHQAIYLNAPETTPQPFNRLQLCRNKIFGPRTANEWSIDARRVKEGRIEGNEITGGVARGMYLYGASGTRVASNHFQGSTAKYQLDSSEGGNVIENNYEIQATTTDQAVLWAPSGHANDLINGA